MALLHGAHGSVCHPPVVRGTTKEAAVTLLCSELCGRLMRAPRMRAHCVDATKSNSWRVAAVKGPRMAASALQAVRHGAELPYIYDGHPGLGVGLAGFAIL